MTTSKTVRMQPVEHWLLTDKGWKLSNLGSPATVYSETFTKPDTFRRAKPVDLFASGTARIVSSEVAIYGWGKRQTGVNAYTMMPVPGPAGVGVNSPSPDFQGLDGRLLAKIKSQNVNLAQALAEYRQTSNLVATSIREVLSAFHSLRRGRGVRDFIRALSQPRSHHEKALANRWLQYQYGWKPLMSDIYGSVDALASQIRTGMYLYVDESSKEFSSRSSSRYDFYFKEVSTHASFVLQSRVHARYRIYDPALKQLSSVGISNPALLLWELIPYSFVLDWFVPVGEWLSALDALNGVSDLRVIRSHKLTSKYTARCAAGDATVTKTLTDRKAPSASLSLPPLRWEPSLSWTKLTSSVALARQLRR